MKRIARDDDNAASDQQYAFNDRQAADAHDAARNGTPKTEAQPRGPVVRAGDGPGFTPNVPPPPAFAPPLPMLGLWLLAQQGFMPQRPGLVPAAPTRNPVIAPTGGRGTQPARSPTVVTPLALPLPDGRLAAPAMPPSATRPGAPGANALSSSASSDDFFKDQAFMARVEQNLNDPRRWRSTCEAMNPEERIRFGMASMLCLARSVGPKRFGWKSMLAAACRDMGIERLLAQKWPYGWTSASLLIALDLNEVLAQVLHTEAGRNSLSQADEASFTPLHNAALYRDAEAVKLILDFDDESGTLRMQRDKQEDIPLHHAAVVGADDIVGLLLSRKGREQRLARKKAGMLPVHYASAYCGSPTIVKRLLEDAAQEQLTARGGRTKATPLQMAVSARAVEVVRVLLAVKSALPQQLTMRDAEGNDALGLAIRTRDTEIIALIEEAMKELPSTASSSGAAALTTASGIATTSSIAPLAGNGGPVPMTPMPMTPMPEPGFDAYESGSDAEF